MLSKYKIKEVDGEYHDEDSKIYDFEKLEELFGETIQIRISEFMQILGEQL